MLCAVGMIAWALGCGGGSKAGSEAKGPEPAVAAPSPDSAAAKVEDTCQKLCERVGDACEGDPVAEFDAETCQEACIDETDGVLMDVDRCLGKAESCAEAIDCRAKFGD